VSGRSRFRRTQSVKWATASLGLLVCSVMSITAYYDLERDRSGGSSPTLSPIPVGVYLSGADKDALQHLRLGDGSQARPSWHTMVEAQGHPAGVALTVSLGRLLADQFGNPYGNEGLSGTLSHSVTIVFSLPSGAAEKSVRTDVEKAVDPNEYPGYCAHWESDVKGHRKQIDLTPVWLPGGDGWPDVAICRIPPIPDVIDLDISMWAYADVPALEQSISGASSVAISNPGALTVTMGQSDSVPQDLMYTGSERYRLDLIPPVGSRFETLQPPAVGAGPAGRRVWSVEPGGFISTDVVDPDRRALSGVAEEVLLIMAGFFLGLFASVLPRTFRAWTRPRAGNGDPIADDALAVERGVGKAE